MHIILIDKYVQKNIQGDIRIQIFLYHTCHAPYLVQIFSIGSVEMIVQEMRAWRPF